MSFRAPVRDLAFALQTLGHDALFDEAFPNLDGETVTAVLEAAGTFASEVLAPLNRLGDVEGARCRDGRVTLPAGFGEAYRAYADGGWNALSGPPEFGGQGLTRALDLAVFEIMDAANLSFALCPILTQGAIEALLANGSETQKRLIVPKLASGEWTGTMNLTESQAGSDLAALATRAEPDGRGGYRLFGEKIFISWGDHDMAENICHLVLARTPEAPPGLNGISLFLAPKRLVNADGGLGTLNALRPASIEHKLGLHASPTCVMLFEGAQAELVGDLGRGLPHMFVMMNAARLHVGVQGVAIAERAFQQALAFTLERRQGRSAWAADYPAAIYDHPDVRRTLMLMKARIEAARSICLYAALLADISHAAGGEAEREAARARREFLTPIAKAWSTDVGVEVASLGLQLHGGTGYVEETGAAQHYRDARILPIYEGTNGIQALDLAGRKLRVDGGASLRALAVEMAATARRLEEIAHLAPVGRRLSIAVSALLAATEWQLSHPDGLAAASPFLKLAGDVIGGWMLGRQALAAEGADAPWLKTKAGLARLFANEVLAQAPGLADGLMQDAWDLKHMNAEALGA